MLNVISIRRAAWGQGVVPAAAVLTALMGLVDVLSALTPSAHSRLLVLEKYSPLQVTHGGHLTSALSGFALLLLAAGLGRRKRVARFLTILVLAGSIVVHLLKGLDYEEASLATILMLALLAARANFHARSDPPSVRQAFLTLLVAIAFTLAYGVAGFYLLDRHFRVSFGLGAAIRQTIVMFTQYYNPGLEPITGFGRYFADSIYTVAVVTTGYAMLLLIRPVLARGHASASERALARVIVQQHGRSSLGRLVLMDDKLYDFSPGGSLIGYVVKGRAALALGDPIGPRSDLANAIHAFKSKCARNDWYPVFYQVFPDNLTHYRRAGLSALQIGQEAIVELANFSLEGGKRRNIRASVNKMRRLGYSAAVLEPPHPAALLHQLNEVSDEWLSDRGGSEMRFSVGWFDTDYLNDCPILVVRSPDGRIEAFANIVLEARPDEITADLMRHRAAAESGQMDFLFVSLFDWAKAQGYARFNFGLSGLSGIGQRPGDPAIERALHFAFEHLNQFYNFKGLHAYKSKYDPLWEPRFLIYPSVGSLPAVGAALIRANTGDDVLGGYLFHPR